MLRRNLVSLGVSPFALFMQDLSKAGKLNKTKNTPEVAAKLYHKQTPAQMAALKRRASAMTYPNQKAYHALVKREWKRGADLTKEQRYAAIKAKWAEIRERRPSKPVKRTATKASSKVKAAAAKASSKVKAAAAKVRKSVKPAAARGPKSSKK